MKLSDLNYSYCNNIICGIYMIFNNQNNKCYIGQSVNIYYRVYNHIKRSQNNSSSNKSYNYPLCKSIRKYGLDNFSMEIIEICKKDDLDIKEIYYIDKYNSDNRDFGYNLTKVMQGSMYRENKLSEKDIDDITNYLLNYEFSMLELSKKYGVFKNSIYNINSGITFFRDNLNYPLRKPFFKKVNCKNCNVEIISRNSICDNCLYLIENNRKDRADKASIKCIVCNKETSNPKFCSLKCSNIFRTADSKPNKKELLELIKINSLTKIGEMYGVSANTISKWCKNYGLPYKSSDIKEYFKKDLYEMKFEKDKVVCKVCDNYFMPSRNKFSYCSEKCRLENLKGHKLRNTDINFEEIVKVMAEKDTFLEVYKHFRTNYKVMRGYCEIYKIPFNMDEFNLWYMNYKK